MQGLAPSLPGDLWHLGNKIVPVRKPLEVSRKDQDSEFRLILVESRIHRLARYCKTKQQIPQSLKYDSATASTLIAQASLRAPPENKGSEGRPSCMLSTSVLLLFYVNYVYA